MTSQTTFKVIRDVLRKASSQVTDDDRHIVRSFVTDKDPGGRYADARDEATKSFGAFLDRIITPLLDFADGKPTKPDELAAAIAFFEHRAREDDEPEPPPTQH